MPEPELPPQNPLPPSPDPAPTEPSPVLTPRKKRFGWVERAARITVAITGGTAVVALLVASFRWGQLTGLCGKATIHVTGHRYLTEDAVAIQAGLEPTVDLFGIDLRGVRENLEAHPYIRGARISRDFPGRLRLEVVEREPVAYVGRDPLVLLDGEGMVMPAEGGRYDFNIPTLSGFPDAAELFPTGRACLSERTVEAARSMEIIRESFPDLYSDLSELVFTPEGNYELYLSSHPTRIYLGDRPLLIQLSILHEFAGTVRGARMLHDYEYVDLRHPNQIVVREKV